MIIRIGASLLLSGFLTSGAEALFIHYGGPDQSMPFEVSYQNTESPLEIVLQISNDSQATASVLAWQLDLQLLPVDDAPGSMLLYDAMAPPDPLFDQATEPQCSPELPPATDHVFIEDVHGEFSGASIPPQSSRNIVRLRLLATSNTAGAFQLVMPFADDPESDSSWFDADDFSPKAFENSHSSKSADYIILGTINLTSSFSVGDFNRDGSVNVLDYVSWAASFGNITGTLGEGADGNRDGIVDAADYVLWRRMTDRSGTSSPIVTAAPETAGFGLSCLGMACAMSVFRHRKRNSAHVAGVVDEFLRPKGGFPTVRIVSNAPCSPSRSFSVQS